MGEPTKAQLLARVAALEAVTKPLVAELAAARRSATEAGEQQKATAEILRVISGSPTDLRPVFDTIVRNAVRLCDATYGNAYRVDGDVIHLVAEINLSGSGWERFRQTFPRPLRDGGVIRDVVESRRLLYLQDIDKYPWSEAARAMLAANNTRSLLTVPMIRQDRVIGAFALLHRELDGFPDTRIELVKTFADQAVIAIENVRLFTELQASNVELTTALDTQTATSDILRVISSSRTDVQPVFDTIVRSAVRLCNGASAAVFVTDGRMLYEPANYGTDPDKLARTRARYPRPLGDDTISGLAIQTRSVIQVPDTEDPSATAFMRETGRFLEVRSAFAVPMLREGEAVGAIIVTRRAPGQFADADIELLKTFADQAVIAIENVRLFNELQASNRGLTTALEQQTATSEILGVISRSPTDVHPVFEKVVEGALRLLGGRTAAVVLVRDNVCHLGASTALDDVANAAMRNVYPRPLSELPLIESVVRDGVARLLDDAQVDERIHQSARDAARTRGYRSFIMVPMVRGGVVVGTINVSHREAGAFGSNHIALLQTFADQAVIAIENVRLFTELQKKNSALMEALEQQTATSEILRVISSSPTDVQPVFDTIARNAVRLCGGEYSTLYRVDGGLIHFVSYYNFTSDQLEAWRQSFPRPAKGTGVPVQRVVQTGTVYRIGDPKTREEADAEALTRVGQRARGLPSLLIVPMFRQGEVIGAIGVTHAERNAFTDAHVELLKTFADQAVIAIENVRLFTELQTSNQELTTALDKQTATSDILRVISRSQTDLQPVFDTIASSAVRLLRGHSGGMTRLDGDQLLIAAISSTDDAGDATVRARFPRPLNAGGAHSTAIRDRAPLNVADTETDVRLSEDWRTSARARGYRSQVAVPLLRREEALGAISVTRREPGGFTDDEIALLQTFADQAVIAIENARLLTELHARTAELTRSVGELRALGEVGRAVSSTLDLETVLTTIVSRAVELSALDGGVVFEYDEDEEVFIHRAATEQGGSLAEARRATRVQKGEGIVGRTAITLEPEQVPDITIAGAYESRLRENLIASGVRAILAVPMVREGRLIGNLVVTRNHPGEFSGESIDLLRTFATQSALAIQNARLFRQLEIKSRELEVASQHKSEFLASMSHELRTPLNAIIGFSDVLLQGMFGETNEKQTEYLRDILASGQHLLSLINDILDLSKIEAGRMGLDVDAFDLPAAIDDALLLMRERAGRRGIVLERHVDERVGEIQADQRKVKQVLLNLLSNAVKFTPEGGRIEVRAGIAGGAVEISVTDTGIGIAPEDQEAVFEEFRQVGRSDKKAEGTGLGLALCRKFVELHGGRIWVKSQIGQGSTFTFTIPVSATPQS